MPDTTAEAPADSSIADLTAYRTPPAEPVASEAPPAEPAAPEKPSESAAPVGEKPAAAPADETPDAKATREASEAGAKLAARRKSIQAEIDAATRQKHDLRREIDAEQARLDALKAGSKAPDPQTAPVDPNDPEPQEDDARFTTYGQYVKAQAQWEARQLIAASQRTQGAEQAQRTMVDAMARSHAAGVAKYPDFDAKLNAAADDGVRLDKSPLVMETILYHPQGHDFAYAMVQDPEALDRLASMPLRNAREVAVAGMEIGRVMAKLEAVQAQPVAPVKPVSQAPAPVAPIGAHRAAGGASDPANVNSVEEWRRMRKDYASRP